MKNILFELNHPKHYYQFKYVMNILKNRSNNIFVIARDKDVLLDVLREEGVEFEIFGDHKKSLTGKIFATIGILFKYRTIVKRVNPQVIVSKASFYGSFISKICGKKSVIFPDSEVVTVTNKFVAPISDVIVTPETFERSFGNKHVKINGFFENCYLAPSIFRPDKNIVDLYGLKMPYAVFRFVGWHANHDVKNSGFTLQEKIKLINVVKPYMQVYISSENVLPKELEKYKLPTPASQIHSVLAYADLYLGDSQTMATEAALLGTPSIRSNSFVGPNDMSNFKILEKKYNLLLNIANFEDVLFTLESFAKNSQKETWNKRVEKYNLSTGDPNKIVAEIIDAL